MVLGNMAHFAKIDQNNVVVDVIVIDQETLNTGLWGDPSSWIQTSYNTRGGVHYGSDGQPDGGVALRKNFASIGCTYDPIADAFIPQQPFPSWILDNDTCLWQAPVSKPNFDINVQKCIWDEQSQSWSIISDT